MNKELTELSKQFSKIKDELRRLDIMEAEAQKKLDAIAQEDVTTVQAQRKIGDARQSLDLADQRRLFLKAQERESSRSLFQLFKAEVARWDSIVYRAKVAEVKRVYAANLPFFEGDERQMKRWYEEMGPRLELLPSMYKYRRAFFEEVGSRPAADWDGEKAVNFLARHMRSHAKAIGLPEPADEPSTTNE